MMRRRRTPPGGRLQGLISWLENEWTHRDALHAAKGLHRFNRPVPNAIPTCSISNRSANTSRRRFEHGFDNIAGTLGISYTSSRPTYQPAQDQPPGNRRSDTADVVGSNARTPQDITSRPAVGNAAPAPTHEFCRREYTVTVTPISRQHAPRIGNPCESSSVVDASAGNCFDWQEAAGLAGYSQCGRGRGLRAATGTRGWRGARRRVQPKGVPRWWSEFKTTAGPHTMA